jgi:hypothetical protein
VDKWPALTRGRISNRPVGRCYHGNRRHQTRSDRMAGALAACALFEQEPVLVHGREKWIIVVEEAVIDELQIGVRVHQVTGPIPFEQPLAVTPIGNG